MPAASQAAAPKVAFKIPTTGLKAALVTFAIQAKVSISTGAAANCRPTGNPLVGRFNLSDGLTRLLAGTGCSFRIIDPQTIEIVRAPPRSQPLHPPQARVSPPDTAPVLVNELVVTATKRTASAGRLPYSVSVVSGETIEGADARGASEIALMSPAVTVTNLGPGRNKIFIRGLSDGPL
ncbi:MAG TPA: TonB-dependent receptor, partial [Phenylobacterium sp.]|nr:TonB-dependent receptor [Phenylobacterium sp.]